MSNNSNLTIYTSLDGLSTRLYDYSNSFLLPSICAFGLFTSSCCLLGSFHKDTSSSKSLNFILIYSLVDFFFLLSQFFVFLFRCGVLCSFGHDFFPQLYQIEIFWLMGYTLVNSQCLFGIYIAITRFRLFKTRKGGSFNPNLFVVYALCAIVAFCANLFIFSLPRRVVPMSIYQPNNASIGRVLYTTIVLPAYETKIMQQITTVVIVVKDPAMYVIYCAVNVMVIYRYQRFMTKKQTLVAPATKSKQF